MLEVKKDENYNKGRINESFRSGKMQNFNQNCKADSLFTRRIEFMNEITKETRQLSFDDIKEKKKIRYEQIIDILDNKEMTAKEIAVEMYKRGLTDSAERNYSQPRLSELAYLGIVKVVGKKICQYTNKKVAVYKLIQK